MAILVPAAVVLLAPAALASAAQAATLTVTTTSDELTSNDGQCSLREALATVNSPGTATDCGTAAGTANTIVLPASPTPYALSIAPSGSDGNSSGDLNVTGTAPLTIRGAGQSATVIDANGLGDRVLSIAAGANVTLRNLEISGGHAPDGAAGTPCSQPTHSLPAGPGGNGANGGGIKNAGTLSLIGVAVAGNAAGAGGRGGSCVSFHPPYSPGGRGGNGANGGGIYNVRALTVTRSAIFNNSAGAGGASGVPIALYSAGGNGGSGGGIYAVGGSLRVTNSTLAGNDAGDGGSGSNNSFRRGGRGGSGGGIYASGLTSAGLVQNATVANNAAGAAGSVGGAPGGGGGLSSTFAQPLTMQNTIVASNNANGSANCFAEANGGHNLSYGRLTSHRDLSCPGTHSNPALLPLGDYGGDTQTMALGSGSAALDRVPATGAGCPRTDQRGVTRPDIPGTPCDIGAFEFAAPTVTITAPHRHAHYAQGAQVVAAYTCSEGGIISAIASGGCVGTVPNGQAIDTSSPGTYSFTVTATDKAGNTITKTRHYTVS